jgi:hypothetical protein
MSLKSSVLEMGWLLVVVCDARQADSENQHQQRDVGHGCDRTAFKVKLRCTKMETPEGRQATQFPGPAATIRLPRLLSAVGNESLGGERLAEALASLLHYDLARGLRPHAVVVEELTSGIERE